MPIFVLICGIAHCLWIAEKFAYTGYWDDTIIFVRHSADGPSNPFQFFLWLLDDYKSLDGTLHVGDLYGPWLVGIIKFGSSIGLLSNWFLILISNFALLGLSATLYFIAVKLGAKRSHSGIAAIIIYFSPQFIDQRTWYVAMQHTTTVLFLVLASYKTYVLLNLSDNKKLKSNQITLNILLILVSLGREIALPYGILVILVVLYTRRPNYQTVTVAWTLPIIYWIQGIIVGRAGTHTQYAIDGLGVNRLQNQLLKYLDFPASKLLFVSMILIIVLQFVLLKKSNKFNGDLKRQDIQSNSEFNLRANTTKITVVLYATVILLIVNYRSVATFGTIFSPTGNTYSIYEFNQRWSITDIGHLPFYLSVIFIIFLLVCCANKWFILITTATVLCTLPYLSSNNIISDEEASGNGVSFMTRYSIYFVPALFFLLIGTLQQVKNSQQISKISKKTFNSFLQLILLFAIFNHASGQNSEINLKTIDFKSIQQFKTREGNDIYCLTPLAKDYLILPYTKSNFPDANTIFGYDFRSGTKFRDEIECYWFEKKLDEIYSLLGAQISREDQKTLDEIFGDYENQIISEKVGREKMLNLARSVIATKKIDIDLLQGEE